MKEDNNTIQGTMCPVPSSTVLPPILQYSNLGTETNLHLCKPRYSKMVIEINFLMANDSYVFLYFSILEDV